MECGSGALQQSRRGGGERDFTDSREDKSSDGRHNTRSPVAALPRARQLIDEQPDGEVQRMLCCIFVLRGQVDASMFNPA